MLSLTDKADYIADPISGTGRFELLSKTKGNGLPLVMWRLDSEER